jgi:hypothetical protein
MIQRKEQSNTIDFNGGILLQKGQEVPMQHLQQEEVMCSYSSMV